MIITALLLAAAFMLPPGWSPLRDDAKGKAVTITLRELLRYTVSLSDNTACDTTIRLLGGPLPVSKRMVELGVPSIRIDRTENDPVLRAGMSANVSIDTRS